MHLGTRGSRCPRYLRGTSLHSQTPPLHTHYFDFIWFSLFFLSFFVFSLCLGIMKPVLPILLAALARREMPQELSHDRYVRSVKEML